MERFTEGSGRRIVTVDNTTVDIACAIHSLSDADLVRLKALARLWARGLPAALGPIAEPKPCGARPRPPTGNLRRNRPRRARLSRRPPWMPLPPSRAAGRAAT